MKQKQNRRKAGKGKGWAVAVAVVLALFAGVAVFVAVRHGQNGDSQKQPGGALQTGAWVQAGGMSVDVRAEEIQETDGSNPLAGRNICFTGIENTSVKPGGVVRLENRAENLDFLMKFKIFNAETGEVVFETELIPSGQSVDWMPGEVLEPGKYHLDFLQQPFFVDSEGVYVALTEGCNRVVLTVKE